jgi:hypothetical protein
MAKLQCPCGFAHDLTTDSETSWITVHESQYSAMIQEEISANDGDESSSSQVIRKHGIIYACPKCQRIMWHKPGEHVILVYTVEDAV